MALDYQYGDQYANNITYSTCARRKNTTLQQEISFPSSTYVPIPAIPPSFSGLCATTRVRLPCWNCGDRDHGLLNQSAVIQYLHNLWRELKFAGPPPYEPFVQDGLFWIGTTWNSTSVTYGINMLIQIQWYK